MNDAGRLAEDRALVLLWAAGLKPVARNWRGGGGELDLVMTEGDTLVSVEVRARKSLSFGGAAASLSRSKRERLRRAAEAFLLTWPGPVPACRFDAVCFDGDADPAWLKQIDL